MAHSKSKKSIVARIVLQFSMCSSVYSARHTYHPEDIKDKQKFADVLSQLPDGKLMIVLGRFTIQKR